MSLGPKVFSEVYQDTRPRLGPAGALRCAVTAARAAGWNVSLREMAKRFPECGIEIKASSIGGPTAENQLLLILRERRGQMVRSLETSFAAQSAALSTAEVAAMVEAGTVPASIITTWNAQYAEAVAAIYHPEWETAWAAGQNLVAAGISAEVGGAALPFAAFQARLSQFIAAEGAVAVTNLTTAQTAAVNVMLHRFVVEEPIGARAAAPFIRSAVGLTEPQAKSLDIFRSNLVTEGVTGTRLEAAVARRSAQMIRRRADVIARTEMAKAYNVAMRETIDASVQEGLLQNVEKRWLTAGDELVDEECCAPMEDDGPIKLSEDFDGRDCGPLQQPPAHPNCRCTVIYDVEST